MALPGLERAKGICSGARLQQPYANPAADQTALEVTFKKQHMQPCIEVTDLWQSSGTNIFA